MKKGDKQLSTPLYATLFYDVRAELDISWAEYVYLDMVYHLSHDGWCFKSLENTGKDLGLDRSSVFRMRNRLKDKGLIQVNRKGNTRTTVMYAKRIRRDSEPVAKRTKVYAKRDSAVGETQPKNNNRITKNNNEAESIKSALAARFGWSRAA